MKTTLTLEFEEGDDSHKVYMAAPDLLKIINKMKTEFRSIRKYQSDDYTELQIDMANKLEDFFLDLCYEVGDLD